MTLSSSASAVTMAMAFADRLIGLTNAQVKAYLFSLPTNTYQTNNDHSGLPWDPYALFFADGSSLQLFDWDDENGYPTVTPGFDTPEPRWTPEGHRVLVADYVASFNKEGGSRQGESSV